MDVAILKSRKYGQRWEKKSDKTMWGKIVRAIERDGFEVRENPVDADVSIVLCGLHENPTLVKGKRVLAFKPQEWFPKLPPPHGWQMYEPLLEMYYDDFIDMSGLDPNGASGRIRRYIDEVKESRSKD